VFDTAVAPPRATATGKFVDMTPKPDTPVAAPVIDEPVTAPEIPLPPGTRRINGRIIRRTRGHITRWDELVPQPPKHVQVRGREGDLEWRRVTPPDRINWQAEDNPAAEVEVMHREYHFRPFDVREPSPLHDEMDRAIAAGFTAWAAELAAKSKLRPRPEFPGEKMLGQCHVGRGYLKIYPGDEKTRDYLRRHAAGDWGEHGRLEDVTLDDDCRWCPPAFSIGTQNAVAVERGAGIVRSSFPIVIEKTRGVETIEIMTSIGECTFVTCPRRGG
jgi:hypothetical protein